MATTQKPGFNPSADIPSLAGKVILITGANSGLGKQSSLELAKHGPAQLWMAARSPEKGVEAVADVKNKVPGAAVAFLELDLSSFDSIKCAAKTVLDSTQRLDILMLNAGLMGCPPKLTAEGYEIQMGTNHMGHALLLELLLPLLERTSGARVVSMASSAWKHAGPEKIQFDTLKSLDRRVGPVQRYIQSKVANTLYATEFAAHHPGLLIVSINPGEVDTNLFTREPGDEVMRSLQTDVVPKVVRPVEEGVLNQLWAATAPSEKLVSGLHYEPVGVHHKPEGLRLDTELAAKLWEWTEKELEGQRI
ncbi:hypothetical protein B0T26DRAFT_872266 [Lasiosphaeria miniovina]|uniref:Oxidoreductase n=1 Tax=Lasiosphaeria miniovina TaxID=1954250 RepID=A0AA40AL94_9PEZI|nr:uncharacterized protein B0T26DRAFT_872266 [Lasiosphaeria miniovina]KAK0717946.1 hypothetical protein B0T26DRAFT_872266 [Lasiosphaeria miniovina]